MKTARPGDVLPVAWIYPRTFCDTSRRPVEDELPNHRGNVEQSRNGRPPNKRTGSGWSARKNCDFKTALPNSKASWTRGSTRTRGSGSGTWRRSCFTWKIHQSFHWSCQRGKHNRDRGPSSNDDRDAFFVGKLAALALVNEQLIGMNFTR